jgi:hypothetical protein
VRRFVHSAQETAIVVSGEHADTTRNSTARVLVRRRLRTERLFL